MPLTVACDDCGKRYTVPEASLGRRVKCKRCGHVFAVVPVPVAAPVLAESDSYRTKDEVQLDAWEQLRKAAGEPDERFAPAASVITARPPARVAAVLGPVGASVRRMGGHTAVTLGLVALAAGFVLVSLTVSPTAALVALPVFLVLAVVYFFGGLAALVAQSARTPGAMRMPWGDLLLIGVQLALSAVIPLPIVVYRRRALLANSGAFFTGLAGLFVRCLLVALLGGVVVWVTMGVRGRSAVLPSHGRRTLPTPTTADDQPYRPTPVPAWRPPPVQVESANTMAATPPPPAEPVVDLAAKQARTSANLIKLAMAMHRYRYRHRQAVPASLADLSVFFGADDPLTSPFGPGGYAYLPAHARSADERVVLYDAAELARTGSTHAVYGTSATPRLVTRAALAAEPGVNVSE